MDYLAESILEQGGQDQVVDRRVTRKSTTKRENKKKIVDVPSLNRTGASTATM